MESNTEQPPIQPEPPKQENEPIEEQSDIQQPQEPPKEEEETTTNPAADVIANTQQEQQDPNQLKPMDEAPSDLSAMKADKVEVQEQESKQTSDDMVMTEKQQQQTEQVTMEQGQQQINDNITEQQEQEQMNEEPVIEQEQEQNQIQNEVETEPESMPIEQELQLPQQPLIERQITDIPQNNESSQINSMESTTDEQQQKAVNEMHAQPQNEQIAAPILVEQNEETQQTGLIDQPKTENNDDENMQNTEDIQHPKVEQQDTEINNEDNDQMMTDNQQTNEIKPEAQNQEIKQQQMAEPMDTDQTTTTGDRNDDNKPTMKMEMDSNNNNNNSADAKGKGMKPELLACINMLNEFMKRPETEPFNEPVDWKGLNLPDYPLIITKPMDLGTVSNKMSNGKYSTAEQFAVDVRLVFNNAMKYNQPGSGIYVVAENLSKQFERRYARITKSSANKKRKLNGTNSTFGQRQTFTQLLQQLTPQELGGVVELIDRKSPQALNDKFGAEDANEDEIEIEVYNIEGPILTELIGFIEKLIAKRGKKKGRKSGYY